MVFHRFSFVILFIPIVIGIHSNTTVKPSQSEPASANTSRTSKTLITVLNNTHDIALVSEGGAIVSEVPIILKENNNTLLIKAQGDSLLENSSKSKGTVARKGVKLEDAPVPDEPANTTEVKLNPKLLLPMLQNKTVLLNKLVKQTTLKPITHEPVHKPLVLSYEALKSIVPEGTSLSAKGILTKQPLNPGSHPGMVMPVVITVLIVPMFAVLGYLALKRGQEAWKNRHYKRMDFLLDGMYND